MMFTFWSRIATRSDLVSDWLTEYDVIDVMLRWSRFWTARTVSENQDKIQGNKS